MDDPFAIQQPSTSAARTELARLNVKDLFFKYVRFLPFFILSVALALFGAFLYLRYATPVYQSSGSLLIKDGQAGGARLSELLTSDNKVNLQNEIELLKSIPIMERVVNRLRLNLSYASKGAVRETDVYKVVPFEIEVFKLTDSATAFAFQLNFVNDRNFQLNEDPKLISFGQTFTTGAGVFRLVRKKAELSKEYIVRYTPTSSLAGMYASQLLVTPKLNTNILLLSLKSTNPQLVADILNQLMREYSVYSVENKNETINQQLDFINGRLTVVDREVDSVRRQLLDYQNANNLINFDAQFGETFGRVQEADKLLTERAAQIEIVNMVDVYLRNSSNNFSTTPSTLGLSDPTLNTLIAGYNVAQLERKSLLDKSVPIENPLVQAKEAQIEKLQQNILENLRIIRASYANSISDLRQQSGLAQSQVKSLPAKQQGLLDIERKLGTKRATYNILLAENERTAITMAATTSNVKIVDNAGPNYTPVAPNRRNIQLMAVVIGLLLPALVIFIKEMLNDKITSRFDIERISAVTVLGEIGHSYAKDALVVKPNNRGVVAEQFRIVRSNLQYVLNNIPKPVILVTSSFSGEGKSFISTNIGAVMALAGKRTIVLEFDIRKPKILSHLNMVKKPGLTNYLLGKTGLEGLPVQVEGYDNLFVLPCGPVPPNPAEILLDPKFDGLFAYLKSNFEVVVMDTAPIGMVSDALTLSKFADATLYIARQGHTYKKQVAMIDDFYTQGKLPKVSVILNDAKLTSGYGYYGSRYGYGYGYGSGYFEEDETVKPGLFSRLFGSRKQKPKNARA